MTESRIEAPARGAPRSRGGFIGEYFVGLGCLLRGLGMYARSPRLMLLGLIPALIAFAVLVSAFFGMFIVVDDIVRWMTPWADGLAEGLRETIRVVVTVIFVGVWLVLSVLLFTALTLLIGQPFYEAISKRVEDQFGGVEGEIDVSFWRSLPRSVAESARLLLFTGFCGLLILPIGLIPVVGQVVAPVLGALVGGWVLAMELTSVPFERRGLRFRHRKAMLKARRPMALGLGTATFVCFLIPGGAVLMMPAAVAGATIMSRRLFGLPVENHAH